MPGTCCGATPPDESTVDVGLATWPILFEAGDRGPQVQVIRGALQALGFGDSWVSDTYTDKVAGAVVAIQKANEIRVDGIWGPEIHSTAQARLASALQR